MAFKQPITTEAAASSVFNIVEPGEYKIFMERYEERQKSTDGTITVNADGIISSYDSDGPPYDQVLCYFRGAGGIGVVHGFFVNYPNNPKAQEVGLSMLKNYGYSCGLPVINSMDELKNLWFSAYLVKETYNDVERNKIRSFLPPETPGQKVPIVIDQSGKNVGYKRALEIAKTSPVSHTQPDDDIPF